MSWIKYHKSCNDAAPILNVKIKFKGNQESITIPMLIDTGAALTILPLNVLEKDLNATCLNKKSIKGYDGETKEHPVFVVDLIIDDNTFPKKQVLGIKKETSHGLIGRDVLSHYMLKCDGPTQKFMLEYTR